MSSHRARVAVVGSANLDVVVRAQQQPAPGETVLGETIENHPGGKGLNQAIAAARFAHTTFVGSVGTDPSAEALLDCLKEYGVDTRHVREVDGSSGTAIITVVSGSGENSIVVLDGANAFVTRIQVEDALETAQPVAVVAQLEIPTAAVVEAAEWADSNGCRFVFNPSPIERLTDAHPADPIRSILRWADPLIVNTGEGIGILGAGEVHTTAEDVAIALSGIARSVVVTDGSRGAHVVVNGIHHFIPPTAVKAVDTTGAGDSFAGTVAALIANGDPLPEAAAHAATIAAEVVATPRSRRRPHR